MIQQTQDAIELPELPDTHSPFLNFRQEGGQPLTGTKDTLSSADLQFASEDEHHRHGELRTLLPRALPRWSRHSGSREPGLEITHAPGRVVSVESSRPPLANAKASILIETVGPWRLELESWGKSWKKRWGAESPSLSLLSAYYWVLCKSSAY